jgi:hypothetical protein
LELLTLTFVRPGDVAHAEWAVPDVGEPGPSNGAKLPDHDPVAVPV